MSATATFARPATPGMVQRRTRYAVLALSVFVSVLLLIAMGSIVRVTGYGLGCPDWPLCYGQVVPPPAIAAWVEFTHRLVGAATSLQIVLLGVVAWRSYRREPWVFRPAVAAVGLLVVQIGLGGLHVLMEIPPATGWVHTGVAMAIAALVASQVAVTHPAAQRLSARAGAVGRNRRLLAAVTATAAATYFLVLTGSYVTRSGASLVCPAFPACGAAPEATGLSSLIAIQMLHRYTAFSVAIAACLTLLWLVRTAGAEPGFHAVALALATLIVIQFSLGITNVLLYLPMWSRTLHLLVAAMLWTGLVMLWVVLRRSDSADPPVAPVACHWLVMLWVVLRRSDSQSAADV
ncbi:MAG: COX15/CtaA family protein [Ardenticatenaceae bacterium]|nr:COX15/CtaA family protein [Ardenticatenaceae bacterium]